MMARERTSSLSTFLACAIGRSEMVTANCDDRFSSECARQDMHHVNRVGPTNEPQALPAWAVKASIRRATSRQSSTPTMSPYIAGRRYAQRPAMGPCRHGDEAAWPPSPRAPDRVPCPFDTVDRQNVESVSRASHFHPRPQQMPVSLQDFQPPPSGMRKMGKVPFSSKMPARSYRMGRCIIHIRCRHRRGPGGVHNPVRQP